MKLVADLHIHSRFSRATSRSLDFVTLTRSALEKGIQIVGTGDFTHPGWLKEIEDQLEPAEDGLFRLRPTFDRAAREGLPAACSSGKVRFCLEVDICRTLEADPWEQGALHPPNGCEGPDLGFGGIRGDKYRMNYDTAFDGTVLQRSPFAPCHRTPPTRD